MMEARAMNPPEASEPVGPAEWEARLVSVRPETPTVRSFSFEFPNGPFAFRPGQYIVVRLPGVSDPRGDSRTFSISSAPSDRGGVTVTTRRGPSPFKQHLFGLSEGATAELWGPFGTFTPDPERAAVLVGGGIGITPFRSVVREAAARRSVVPIVLLYSSRSVDEIVYRRELEDLARRWAPFRLVLSVSRPSAGVGSWSGRTGRIDAAMVREATRDLARPRYYLCGPPRMVEDLGAVLTRDAGVPSEDLRTELFQGY